MNPQIGDRVLTEYCSEKTRVARVLKVLPDFKYVVCRFRPVIFVRGARKRWKEKKIVRRGMFKLFGDSYKLMGIWRGQ